MLSADSKTSSVTSSPSVMSQRRMTAGGHDRLTGVSETERPQRLTRAIAGLDRALDPCVWPRPMCQGDVPIPWMWDAPAARGQ